MTRRRRAIPQARSALYRSARLLGDFDAISQHRVPERVARRIAGRMTARLLSRLFR